jgi:hypothetical protein
MSRLPPFLKSKTINLPRRRIDDIFLLLIRLQNALADGSAIVRAYSACQGFGFKGSMFKSSKF